MKKITIIVSSLLVAFIIMSSGYGLWQKQLTIQGEIDVVPDPAVIRNLESQIDIISRQIEVKSSRILDLIDQQRISNEKAAEEAQKIAEELKKNQNQKNIDGIEPTEEEVEGVDTETPGDTEDDSDTEVDNDVEEVTDSNEVDDTSYEESDTDNSSSDENDDN